MTSLVAARLLTPERFGSVVVALSVAVVALTAQRALVGDTLLAHVTTRPLPQRARLYRNAVTAAAALSVVAAIAGTLVGALPFHVTSDVGWAALWLPGILVQDAFRYVFFSQGRPHRALTIDVTWALAQGIALVVIVLQGWQSVPAVLAAWGLGAVIGAAVGVGLSRINPVTGHPVQWLKESHHLSRWFAGQTVIAQTQAQIILFLIGALLGLTEVAGLRAVQLVLVLPAQSLLLAANSLLVPRIAEDASRGQLERIRAFVNGLALKFGAGFGSVSLLIYLWRDDVIDVVFGNEFAGYADLMSPTAVATVLLAMSTPFSLACRGLQSGHGLFALQVSYTMVAIPAAYLGGLWWGVVGSAWGLALGTLVLLLSSMFACRRALARTARAPATTE